MRRITLVDYDPTWPENFHDIARELRHVFGDGASRMDHIGSTSVPGLAAKPVIDIQVSVATLSDDEPWRSVLVAAGWEWDASNIDRTKRFFVLKSVPAAQVHVREAGSLTEQLALVFRDYLREHRDAALRYEAFKKTLAMRMWQDGNEYADAKTEIVWPLTLEATRWAMLSGWRPGPTDA
jgi:GrpB-like predicted nucleotidyltransferase (UPF0157 family)